MKVTATAPSNIAFIKYWGKKDETLRLPENASISMNLSNMNTITTVEFSGKYKKDSVIINNKRNKKDKERVIKHLNRIRKISGIKEKAKVVSETRFSIGTGSSSSAAGFAALSLAGVKAADFDMSEKNLSILARQGSGSACRSIPDGFVEWLKGKNSKTSYSYSLYPASYWNILDIVAVVNKKKKEIKSTKGMKNAKTSSFYKTRLKRINSKIKFLKLFIKNKDFVSFGHLIEAEALELHSIMLTCNPYLMYWLPNTVLLMHLVRLWRKEFPVYFTINTGQDIHIIVEEKNKDKLLNKLKKVKEIKHIFINKPSKGARLIKNHLF